MTENSSLNDRATDLFASLPLKEYLAFAQYRKWWIILSAIVVTIPAVMVALHLPDVYSASTIIMVDAQKVPESYVQSPVNSSLNERLGQIEALVFSTTNLEKLITGMNLYPDRRRRSGDEAVVQYMRRAISVDGVLQNGRPVSAFRISYRGSDPMQVTQVATRLTSMFIEENLKVREQQSYGTADFLNTELSSTKAELEKKEAELRSIKSRYVMDLPESAQYHLEALQNLQAQIRDSEDRVRAAQQQKVYLQSMMASYAPTVDLDVSSAGSGSQAELEQLEARLGQLESRYGPGYPDVRKARAELEAAKKRAAEEEMDHPTARAYQKPTRTQHNPVLESQIAKLDDEIKAQTKLKQDLQPQIEMHMSKLAKTPIVEQQMSGLMRDYDTLRNHYLSLLDKKLSADTADDLEKRQKGERFVILDSAHVPDKPVGPNRLLISVAGLTLGLGAGIALAFLREMTDTCVRNEPETAKLAGGAVLVCIPEILSERGLRLRRLRAAAALSGTTIGAIGIGLILCFFSGRLI